MSTTATARPGETLSTIAARVFPGGDVSRLGELLAANPELSPLQDTIAAGTEITIPGKEQLLQYAQPVLTSIAGSFGGAGGIVSSLAGQLLTGEVDFSIPSILGQLSSLPGLEGYPQEAIALISAINGGNVKDAAIAFAKEKLTENAPDQLTNLIPWLLSEEA